MTFGLWQCFFQPIFLPFFQGWATNIFECTVACIDLKRALLKKATLEPRIEHPHPPDILVALFNQPLVDFGLLGETTQEHPAGMETVLSSSFVLPSLSYASIFKSLFSCRHLDFGVFLFLFTAFHIQKLENGSIILSE